MRGRRPGELTFGSGGAGSQAHMGGEMLKAMAGIDMVHIAYKGVGDSIKDLVGGQISMIVAQVPSVKPFIDSGKLRALGVASAQRIAVLPAVPTVAEAGNLKGYEAVSWYALVGPAGIPKDVVVKIQTDVARFCSWLTSARSCWRSAQIRSAARLNSCSPTCMPTTTAMAPSFASSVSR